MVLTPCQTIRNHQIPSKIILGGPKCFDHVKNIFVANCSFFQQHPTKTMANGLIVLTRSNEMFDDYQKKLPFCVVNAFKLHPTSLMVYLFLHPLFNKAGKPLNIRLSNNV